MERSGLAGCKGKIVSIIQIYTTPYCPYCIRAKQLLDTKKIQYEEFDVSANPTLRETMTQLSGRYTVPQIFINHHPIGGCDELYALEQQGQLNELLKQ
jgi:glutaredoxin 3